MSSRVLVGDCIDLMAELEPESVHAIVCDPPYGLEFMGKAWDSFRVDEPGTNRHRGDNAGDHGKLKVTNETNPAAGRVQLGGGARPSTFRCSGCGKRDQFRNPHECEGAEWRRELIDPHAAPPTMLAYQEWSRTWGLEAKRVLKPGGYLLAFGGTRTYHRLTSGLEDAGFEIRDCLVWLYGQGFPKSLDVAKAIDKAEHPEAFERVPAEGVGFMNPEGEGGWNPTQERLVRPGKWSGREAPKEAGILGAYSGAPREEADPISDDAKRWQGWGTALKPAHEPIVVARKPLEGTVIDNVRRHGTGAMNLAAGQIGFADEADELEAKGKNRHGDFGTEPGQNQVYGDFSMVPARNYEAAGRWPANVALDEEAAAMLDEQAPDTGGGRFTTDGRAGYDEGGRGTVYGGGFRGASTAGTTPLDRGGASRFFYCAKASRAERDAGLAAFEARLAGAAVEGFADGSLHRVNVTRADQGPSERKPARNPHPTVKPVSLMRWLVRMVTRPAGSGGAVRCPVVDGCTGCRYCEAAREEAERPGLVLDPFTGSGTTGIACELEGFDFVGCEQDPANAAIAEARIGWWAEHGADALAIVAAQERGEADRAELESAGQLGLFDE